MRARALRGTMHRHGAFTQPGTAIAVLPSPARPADEGDGMDASPSLIDCERWRCVWWRGASQSTASSAKVEVRT